MVDKYFFDTHEDYESTDTIHSIEKYIVFRFNP